MSYKNIEHINILYIKYTKDDVNMNLIQQNQYYAFNYSFNRYRNNNYLTTTLTYLFNKKER